MRLVFVALSIVGTLAIPVAVVSSVVLGLVNDARYYHDGQVKYQVTTTTQMSQSEIDKVNIAIVRFFNGQETLPTALEASGASPVVFQLKEILHMNDVRDVIRAIAAMRLGSGLVVGLVIVGSIAGWRGYGRQALARALVYSSILTIVVGGIAAGLTFVAFDQLFLTFHELTFHNDYWELDPRTDHLIQMFPFGFWYDAMLTVAFRVVLVTLLLFCIGIALRRVRWGLWRRV